MVIGKSKSSVSGGSSVNWYKFSILIVCKNIVENFVAIALLLKEFMILLKRTKCNFIEQNF